VGVVGVAGVVCVGVVGVVWVGVVGVVWVGVDVVVCVGVEGVVSVVVAGVVSVWVAVLVVWQCWRASCPTVDAPWLRLLRSVALTELGRFATALDSSLVALETVSQLPDASAVETWSSWLLRLLA
jgi:hypothetical protein